MRLELDKDFRIEGDLNSFTLYYHHVSEELNDKGNPVVSKDQWYYPTIKLCLEAYLNTIVGALDYVSPEAIIGKYDELLAKIGGIKEFTWNSQNDEIVRLKEQIKELKETR